MAISFACECGRQVRARDEFAGRRMRCPDCGQILTVPEASQPESLDLAEPDLIVSEPPTVVHERAEPASSRIQDQHDALDVDQIFFSDEPKPAAILATSGPKLTPPPSPARRGNPWIDHCLEQRATAWAADSDQFPRERAAKKRSGLWFGAVLLLLAVGAIATGWRYLPSTAARDAVCEGYCDLDFVPENTVGFASVRLADLWTDLSTRSEPTSLDPLERFIRTHTGLAPREIERITLVLPPGRRARIPRFMRVPLQGKDKERFEPFRKQFLKLAETLAWSGNYLIFIRTTEPVDATAVCRAFAATSVGTPHQTFQLFPVRSWIIRDGGLVFLNRRTVLLGRETELKQVIDSEPNPPVLLRAALEQAKDKQIVLDLPKPLSQEPPFILNQIQQRLAQARQEIPFGDLTSAALVIHEGKQAPLPK